MARTIKLKESDLTKIVRRIANTKNSFLFEEEKDKKRPKLLIKMIIDIITLVGSAGSDSRLKKNIVKVGKSPSGIPIYEFEYKNQVRFGSGTYRGVLAEQAPRKAVSTYRNGYKVVDYSKIDVDFKKVNPTKGNTIKLKESDLTNVIKRVINEKLYDDGKGMFPGGPGPTFPGNPFDEWDDFGGFGGMSQGGGSDDPMGRGNEEMYTDGVEGSDRPGGMMMSPEEQMVIGRKIMAANPQLAELEAELLGNGTTGADPSAVMPWGMEVISLIRKAGREMSTGNLSRVTINEINTAKKKNWFQKLVEWVTNQLFECSCGGGAWGPCPC